MIVLLSALLGIVMGVVKARKRNGNRLDILQYATGYGIAFAIVGVFLNLLIKTYIFT